MAENPFKKPRLMETSTDGNPLSKKGNFSLEPKYLVQIDEAKQSVFITIPPENAVCSEEMKFVAKIVTKLDICPKEWKKSVIRLIGSRIANYEGGTEYHWQQQDPPLSTIIVVKRIQSTQKSVLGPGSAGGTVTCKSKQNFEKVDQQRKLLQQLKQQRKSPQAPMPPPKPVKQYTRNRNPVAKVQLNVTGNPIILQKSSSIVIPSGNSTAVRVGNPSITTSFQNMSVEGTPSSSTSSTSKSVEVEADIEDLDADEERLTTSETTVDTSDDLPFKIIDWSKADLPLTVKKSKNGRIYFSQAAVEVGVDLLQNYLLYLKDFAFVNEFWNVKLAHVRNSSLHVLGIYEVNNDSDSMTVLRSIQMFSDGTINVIISGKDCTEEFLKKMFIENTDNLKELIQLASTSKICAGSIGFDIVPFCENAFCEGKVWYSKDCLKVIFDISADSTCNPCKLVRSALRIEKSKIYRQIQDMERENLQETIAKSDSVQQEGLELGKAIYDLIGGFWEEMKIEEKDRTESLRV